MVIGRARPKTYKGEVPIITRIEEYLKNNPDQSFKVKDLLWELGNNESWVRRACNELVDRGVVKKVYPKQNSIAYYQWINEGNSDNEV